MARRGYSYPIEFEGTRYRSIGALARAHGLTTATVCARLASGITGEQLIAPPGRLRKRQAPPFAEQRTCAWARCFQPFTAYAAEQLYCDVECWEHATRGKR